jgi:hypothetical protein
VSAETPVRWPFWGLLTGGAAGNFEVISHPLNTPYYMVYFILYRLFNNKPEKAIFLVIYDEV